MDCKHERKTKDGVRIWKDKSRRQKWQCQDCGHRWTEPFVEQKAAAADPLEVSRVTRTLRASQSQLKDENKRLHERNDLLERKLEIVEAARSVGSIPALAPAVIVPPESEGCAIALASDWHVGEVVKPKTVNFQNEYTPEIAEARARNYFRNLLKLVKKERQDVRLDQLVLWLGGDLITNTIHEELLESNAMSPTMEILFAQRLIAEGIQYLLNEGDFEKIVIPCSWGNHGRTTHKIRISTGADNSYEYLMYRLLEERFQDPRIQWQVSDSYTCYVNIFDTMLRFSHGDGIKYQGGIGGITVPLNRWIHRADEQFVAERDFIGHFHQLFWGTNVSVNGSLIGFTPYALRYGFSPEPPRQSFEVLDRRRGFTVKCPIIVTE